MYRIVNKYNLLNNSNKNQTANTVIYITVSFVVNQHELFEITFSETVSSIYNRIQETLPRTSKS